MFFSFGVFNNAIFLFEHLGPSPSLHDFCFPRPMFGATSATSALWYAWTQMYALKRQQNSHQGVDMETLREAFKKWSW